MVEFALVGLLFVLLLTGLITFGLILSFKQNLTQAAAEGARAGAVAASGTAQTAAENATNSAVDEFDQECNMGALTCVIDPPAPCVGDPVKDCITVRLEYDYDADPIIPPFPILSGLYPSTIAAGSTAEVNP